VLETNLEGLALFNRGKVRDIYAWGDRLLIVATDRISAFDSVLPTGIPLKGKVLTALTEFWLALLSDVTPSHLITTDVSQMGEAVCRHARLLRGRSMLVRKAKVLPIECVVRGYLAGSGWKEYQRSGGICGLRLPRGLREAEELPEPIFTAATKAMTGHDENITFEQAARLAGERLAAEARDRSLALYNRARDYARRRGILIGDTKFEWGLVEGGMILVDEVLTPDSSRFWPAESYEPGHPQPSFDKQFVRDYLMETGWNREPPAPELPPEIVRKTTEKYREAYRRLTGRALAD
jgi:phosphoribosylaminoimidazole-succinocarboxamide synthase